MRIVAGLAAALVATIFFGMRLPVVEDALFDRALAGAMNGAPADLLDDDGLNVFFCGTGSPLPSLKRAQTCTAVIAAGKILMIDAGSGSWERVRLAGLPVERLAGVFLTHLHSDHIADLGEANLGSWVGGRSSQLAVYGPAGTERIVAGVNAAYALDNGYRTAHHGEAIAPTRTAGLEARSFDAAAPSVVYEAEGVRVTAFPVKHDPVSPAVGYRVDYKGRSVVVSGDTAYSESLVANADGADVLIHEAQANHMLAKMAATARARGAANTGQIFDDIVTYHTSPEEAARAANEANAKWLVLTHLTPAPDNAVARRIFLRGVSKVRSRNVKLAEDGMLIALPEGGGAAFSKL